MKKLIVFIILLLPLNVLAQESREELLDALDVASSYGYQSIRYTDSFFDFRDDLDIAEKLLEDYRLENGLPEGLDDLPGEEDRELVENFYYKAAICELMLRGSWLLVWGLRMGLGDSGTPETTKESLEYAQERLDEAHEIHSEMVAEETDDDDSGSSSSGGCFIGIIK